MEMCLDQVQTTCVIYEWHDTRQMYPLSICVDSLKPSNCYVGDATAIRYCDVEIDHMKLIAGGETSGFADGIGRAARFDSALGLACPKSGDRLYVADFHNHRIRMVDLKTRSVTTVVGNGGQGTIDGLGQRSAIRNPRKLAFDRSRDVTSQSVLYITGLKQLRRLDLTKRHLTTPKCKTVTATESSPNIDLYGIASLLSGQLIVTSELYHSVYLCDPRLGRYQLLAGAGGAGESATARRDFVDGVGTSARFSRPSDVVVLDSERCSYIADSGNRRLRHMTLPAYLFENSK